MDLSRTAQDIDRCRSFGATIVRNFDGSRGNQQQGIRSARRDDEHDGDQRGSEADRAVGLLAVRARLPARRRRACATEIARCASESQVPYHMVAQGLEFALHAYLRANGVTTAELRVAAWGISLVKAMALCEAPWNAAASRLSGSPRFGDLAGVPHGPRLRILRLRRRTPMRRSRRSSIAGVWILGHVAPIVADHYVRNLGGDGSPTRGGVRAQPARGAERDVGIARARRTPRQGTMLRPCARAPFRAFRRQLLAW